MDHLDGDHLVGRLTQGRLGHPRREPVDGVGGRRAKPLMHPASLRRCRQRLKSPEAYRGARAAKDRLTAPPFLDAYAKLLKPGGLVHLKTDSDLLYHFSVDAIQRWGGRAVAASEDIHGENPASMGAPEIGSAFETAARSEGRAIKYLAFALEK